MWPGSANPGYSFNLKFTMKIKISVSTLLIFALFQIAEGVTPAPEGDYPGFNTAEGQNALFSLSTGVGNTGVGWFSLFSNTDGSYNTALGAGTLLFNAGNQNTGEGIQNTAIHSETAVAHKRLRCLYDRFRRRMACGLQCANVAGTLRVPWPLRVESCFPTTRRTARGACLLLWSRFIIFF